MNKVIWVFNQYASTPFNSTGAGERHFFIAKELANKGINTYIFAASYSHLFKRAPRFKGSSKVEDYFGFQFTWVRIPKYSLDSTFGRVFSWLSFPFMLLVLNKEKYPKPNIIVVSSMSMFPMIAAFYYKLKFNSKIIFEVRDIWPLTITSLGNFSVFSWPFIKMMEWLEKLSYKTANHIVSVLPYAIDHIETKTKNFNQANFTWIPNGIEPDYFESEDAPEKHEIVIPEEYKKAKIIAYAGSLGQANAMEFFVDAILKLKGNTNFFFLFIGEGPMKAVYENKLAECANVQFIGKVHKGEVLTFLSRADLLYIGWYNLPIYKFGVSANKYNDYMLSGKPILTSSNIKGDVVDLAQCGIKVAPESVEKIIEGLNLYLKMDAETIAKFGENGKKYVMEHNTYKVLADRYESIYTKL